MAVSGNPPLKYPVIKFLLSHPRLDINKQDYSGATALIYAVFSGDPEVVRLLLTHPGIDINVKTWRGKCSSGWHGGWNAGVTAPDLCNRLRFTHSKEVRDEMREIFCLAPLPPSPPPEPEPVEDPKEAGIALGVKFGLL